MKSLFCFIGLVGVFGLHVSLAQDQQLPSATDSMYFERAVAFFPGQIDSCIYYFRQGVPYYERKQDWVKYVNCYNALGSCFYYKRDFVQWIIYTEEAMKKAQALIDKDNDAYSSALSNMAQLYTAKENFGPSIELLKEALDIEIAYGTIPGQSSVLSSLALVFFSKGDFEESKNYHLQALQLREKEFGTYSIEVASSNVSLGNLHQATSNLDSAKVLFEKAVAIFSQKDLAAGPMVKSIQLNAQISLAQIALTQNHEADFLQHIENAQNISQATFNHASLLAYNLLGERALQRKKYAEAIRQFEKGYQQSLVEFQGFQRHSSIGKSLIYLAQANTEAGQYEQGLDFYQKAFLQFTTDFSDTLAYSNPALSDLNNHIDVLSLLEGKARALHLASAQNPDQSNWQDQALETYQLAIQFMRQLRQGYLAVESKNLLAEKVIPIFEGTMEILYQKYQKNPSEQLADQILQTAESSKAILLLESMQENAAIGFGGIPENLLEQERELKLDINFYQQKILDNKGYDTQKENVAKLEGILFELRQDYQDLILLFEKDYPEYYQIKYNIEQSSLAEVQGQLENEQTALVEYFVGEQKLYLIYISQNDAKVIDLPKDEKLNEQTELLRRLLHQTPEQQQSEKDYQDFVRVSQQLYQQLLAPLAIPATIDRLLVVPDDILGYIPFEVLLKQAPRSKDYDYSPSNLDYLINSYQISYNYSATLWLQNLAKPTSAKAPKNFVGFAPSFQGVIAANQRTCTNEDLYNLRCNSLEVDQINAILKGSTYSDLAATKSTFLEEVNQYRVVHLATHSCLDDENPRNNKIFLTGDYLSHFDLANLDLKADLAVLSACNTGNGPLRRGEGVMSLSRDFMMAGCPSTLISLWSVEDCTTAEIMQQYYQHLYAGATKDSALQKAKLDFLRTADRLHAHPFYWAPFVAFGDQGVLELEQRLWWPYLLLGSLGLLFLFGRFFNNRT